MSVDGYIAGTNGEMDWMVWDWDDELKNYVKEITEPVGCIVPGRKLSQGFIPYWTAALNKPEPEEGAKKMIETSKVVFSKTLAKSDPIALGWVNTVLAKGTLLKKLLN